MNASAKDGSSKTRALMSYVGAVISATIFGCCYSGVVMFAGPACEKFGCDATSYALVFTGIGLGMMVGGLFTGGLFTKYSPKVLGAVSCVGPALLYGSLALANGIVPVIVAAFLFGCLFGLGSTLLVPMVVNSWFDSGQGIAFSMSVVAGNIGGILVPPLIATLVTNLGVSSAAFIVAAFAAGVVLLSCLFLVSDYPSAYGASPVPFGKGSDAKAAVQEAPAFNASMPSSLIARTPMYVMIIACILMLTFGVCVYATNSVMIFQGFGLEYIQASYAVSIASAAAIALVSLFGILCDKLGPRVAIVGYSAVAGAVMLVSPMLRGMAGAGVLALLVNCIQCGNMYAAMSLPRLYGTEASAKLIGWATTASGIGSMVAPPLIALLAQATGGYDAPLAVGGALALGACAITFVALGQRSVDAMRQKDAAYAESHASADTAANQA